MHKIILYRKAKITTIVFLVQYVMADIKWKTNCNSR